MNNTDNKVLKTFEPNTVLHASDLNNINNLLRQIAKKSNIHLGTKYTWRSGAILTAESLNGLLKDVKTVYSGLGLGKIHWSFGSFEKGTVLKAEHLNEIVAKIQRCMKKSD